MEPQLTCVVSFPCHTIAWGQTLEMCSLQFPLSLLPLPCYWCCPPSRMGPGHVSGGGICSVVVPGSSLNLSLLLGQGNGLSMYILAHYPCPSLAAPHTISGLSVEPLTYPWSRYYMCSSVEVAVLVGGCLSDLSVRGRLTSPIPL